MRPTPKNPVVLNADGTVSLLVYQERTLSFRTVHRELDDPTGYKARFALTDVYGNPPLVMADSEAGTVSLALYELGGTVIDVTIPDEDMVLSSKAGKFDLVLEDPDGHEKPLIVGNWVLWKAVTP